MQIYVTLYNIITIRYGGNNVNAVLTTVWIPKKKKS